MNKLFKNILTKKKFYFALIMIITVCLVINFFAQNRQNDIDSLQSNVNSSHSNIDSFEDDINSFLYSKGMPLDVIEELPEKQKELIYETLGNNASFESYEKWGQLNDEDIIPINDNIPSSKLNISLIAFKEINADNLYTIYPSFVWNEPTITVNDSFAMVLYPNWEVLPGENNLKLCMKNTDGEITNSEEIEPFIACASGYVYKIYSDTGIIMNAYEGHSYLRAIKKSSDAAHMITLSYVDDTSSRYNISYSVSIGYASISVSGSDDNLRVRSGNFHF